MDWNRQEGQGKRIAVAAGMLATILMFSACVGAPETPVEGAFMWESYSNKRLGITLEYPDVYTVEEYHGGSEVAFRFGGAPALRLSHLGEKEGEHRGLWFGRGPLREIELGGRSGKRYQYTHYDGPFGSPTISYVIEHQGKFMALEFRTMNSELDEAQCHTLDSFRIIETEMAAALMKRQ